jgi:transcription initiation factor TFIIIB Brf1 subunit/transcription initiation factor TFIIB
METEIWKIFDLLHVVEEKPIKKKDKRCSCGENYVESFELIVCENCGCVLDDNVFVNYEDFSGESSYPTKRTFGSNSKLLKMQEWNKYTPDEKAEYKLVQDIQLLCEKNNIPQNVAVLSGNMSKIYFKELKDKKGARRSRVRDGCIGICLWYASSEFKFPISQSDICKILDIDIKYFTRANKQFMEMININPIFKKSFNLTDFHYQKTEYDFVSDFLHKLNLYSLHSLVNTTLKYCQEFDILPSNIASTKAVSAIYFVILNNNLPITKNQLAEKCGISTVTITKTCNNILKHKSQISNLFLK